MSSHLPAFMSHAHADNTLCDPIHLALTQKGVSCYYDRQNPQFGHSLSLALQQELERARALIVMVSSASLASFWVNEEIDMFYSIMAQDRTRTLIPIKIAACELPPRLRSRWWIDATTTPLPQLIDELTHALEVSHSSNQSSQRPGPSREGPFSRVVDWRRGMGDYTTLAEALSAAQPGERILVRRGVYQGGVVIEKPVEVIGDGQLGDVEIEASGADVIRFKASHGRLVNVTLRQKGGGAWDGIDIMAGRLELEGCDISSQGRVGVAVHQGATPTVRSNRIHDGKAGGVFVYEQGQGLFEDNDIFANTNAGVSVATGASPTVRSNRIHDGKQSGVFVYEQGQGLFEDNDIFANTDVGVLVTTGASPTVRSNRINRNTAAIVIHEQGSGIFERNDLRANKRGPWVIEAGSESNVIRRENVETE